MSGGDTTDDGFKLDISQCLKLRLFRPGSSITGAMRWEQTCSGEVIATIDYEADMRDQEDSWVRLVYAKTYQGVTTRQDYRINLITTPLHFGGVRWWFKCPLSSRRVRCLHLVERDVVFAGRKALNLGYRCQRESWSDQRLRAARAADAKLAGTGNLCVGPPSKPKWMRWPTYWGLVRERERASLQSLIGCVIDDDVAGMLYLVGAANRADPTLLESYRRS